MVGWSDVLKSEAPDCEAGLATIWHGWLQVLKLHVFWWNLWLVKRCRSLGTTACIWVIYRVSIVPNIWRHWFLGNGAISSRFKRLMEDMPLRGSWSGDLSADYTSVASDFVDFPTNRSPKSIDSIDPMLKQGFSWGFLILGRGFQANQPYVRDLTNQKSPKAQGSHWQDEWLSELTMISSHMPLWKHK